MAKIWFEIDDEWKAVPIRGSRATLKQLVNGKDDGWDQWRIQLHAISDHASDHYFLFPPNQPVRINGHDVAVGIAALQHTDEVRLPNGRIIYFSTDRQPEPVRYQLEGKAFCSRCKTEVHQGQRVIQCPNPSCSHWYHEDPDNEMSCWSYAPTCLMCGHSTDLTADNQWRPDQLPS